MLAGDEQRHNTHERPATDDSACDLLVFCDCRAGYHQGTESHCEATPQPVLTSPNPMPDSFQFELVSMCLQGFKRCQKSLGHPGNNFVVQPSSGRQTSFRRIVVAPTQVFEHSLDRFFWELLLGLTSIAIPAAAVKSPATALQSAKEAIESESTSLTGGIREPTTAAGSKTELPPERKPGTGKKKKESSPVKGNPDENDRFRPCGGSVRSINP